MIPQAIAGADGDLIGRLKDGEPEAMALLYCRYSKTLHSLFAYITRDAKAAEDLTQEFFLRLSSRPWMFDASKGSLDVWLRSLARNMAIDQMRSGSVRLQRRFVQPENMDRFTSGDDSDLTMQQKILVRETLLQLKPARRYLLELAYFHGYSQVEIAALMDQPLGTVKSNIRMALIELGLVCKAKRRRQRLRC